MRTCFTAGWLAVGVELSSPSCQRLSLSRVICRFAASSRRAIGETITIEQSSAAPETSVIHVSTPASRSSGPACVPTVCAFVQRDLRFCAIWGENDADDVKAARRPSVTRQAANIAPRNREDVALLGQVHRGRGWRKFSAGPRFHLNEAQHSSVPSDQVDFAAVTRHAKVRGHDAVAETSQVKVGFQLAAPSSEQMLRIARRHMPSYGVQTANYELGEPNHDSAIRCYRRSQLYRSPCNRLVTWVTLRGVPGTVRTCFVIGGCASRLPARGKPVRIEGEELTSPS
jgi:hypothetical protein